jgi:hypothetical protein
VDSTVDKGSRFSFLIPLILSSEMHSLPSPVIPQTTSTDIERFVEASSSNQIEDATTPKTISPEIPFEVHERSGPAAVQSVSRITPPDVTSDKNRQNCINLRVLVVEVSATLDVYRFIFFI